MKTIVKKFTNYVILISILAIVLGIVLIAYPGFSLKALGIIVGAYLVVQGIMYIILDIKAWRLFIPFEGMLKGILSLILGILLLKNPETIATYIGLILGIYIIVHSFSGIKLAASLRFTGAPWILMIILNIINIILGGLILYSPVMSALSLTMYIGIVLIIYSVVNIVYMIVVKKNGKDLETLIAEKTNVVDANAEVVETEAE